MQAGDEVLIFWNWKNEEHPEGVATLLEYHSTGLTFFSDKNSLETDKYNAKVRKHNDEVRKANRRGVEPRQHYRRFKQPNLYRGERWLVEFEDGFRTYRWIIQLVTDSNSLTELSDKTTYDIKPEVIPDEDNPFDGD